jgi:type IV pilus assembly protein PilY1
LLDGGADEKYGVSAGGGTYYPASDATQLKIGFDSFFADVQAVNSVFVSSSLPVSVNTQGTYLNQVYMGMFRPDADARARWIGNLKEYKFTFSSATGELKLADSAGADAINPSTGFIKPTGVSYWTTAQTDNGTITPFNFWVNSPSGSPTLTTTQKQQDSPDGDIVDKGGAAQKLRTANLTATTRANRKVYTCPSTGCSTGLLSNFAFNSTNITGTTYETAFGASTTELPTIVDWVRGTDNAGNEAAAGPGTVGTTAITVRPSIHGDVLHSRPVLVNYAATGATTDDVVGFYGANDGTLRAIQAGQGTGSGVELWAFIAPESFGKFRRLRATVNSPATALLQIPSPSSGKSPAVLPDSTGVYKPKDYFFDGSVTSYEERNGSRRSHESLPVHCGAPRRQLHLCA